MFENLLNKKRREPRRIVLAGHSHIFALTGQHYSEVPDLRPLEGVEGVSMLLGPWPRGLDYWQALGAAAPGADVALIWGGNEHNVCYFFQADHAFDFLSKQVGQLIPSFQLVPKNMIRRRFMDVGISDLEKLLPRLVEVGSRRIAVLGTPPPKRDNEILRTMLVVEPFFAEMAAYLGFSIETVPITAPHVRLKLWFLLQEMLAEQAKKVSATFVPVPREAQDEDGFLKREFWTQDVTHANEAYGRLMFAAMLAAFD
jgi:hypothetical protein